MNKRLYATAGIVLLLVLNKVIGLGIDQVTVNAMVGICVAYLAGQSVSDFAKNWK